MSPRKYDMTNRRAAAEATRQRIVQATFEVHGEQGIAGARLDEIAARAGVSLATLYRHFPSYDELVGACGDLTFQAFPHPTGDEARVALATVGDRRRRIERLVDRIHTFYEQTGPTVQMMRTDAVALPVVAERLEILEHGIRAWVDAAVPDTAEPARATVRALVDHRTWTALEAEGVPDPRATVVRLVEAVLASERVHRHPARDGEPPARPGRGPSEPEFAGSSGLSGGAAARS